MHTNRAALDLITRFEGFAPKPYRCPAGVWTIGYGSTRTPQGLRVDEDTVAVTRQEAMAWLMTTLEHTEYAVDRLIAPPLTDNQFGALVSFTYNVGSGNLKASTLRARLNRGDTQGAAAEFPKWRFAKGKVLSGLIRRRAAERALFEG
ncbi:MAG: lysozyme [Hyphomicrobiales bacterium]